jgi:hypothetical protein
MSWLESYVYLTVTFLKDCVIKSQYIQPTVMTIGKVVEGTDHGLISGNSQAFFLFGLTQREETFRMLPKGI